LTDSEVENRQAGYSDLHGFTKLVASQPENKSFVFLHAFVEMATRLTKHYNGEVMDVAGDRVLSAFHRTPTNFSKEPVEDAITFALQLQTIFNQVIGPAFVGDGLGQLSVGVGIDYGEAVIGCVGIRNNKTIVFFGDAANNAAKLQEIAGAGETVLSAIADLMKPAYLNHESWTPSLEKLANGAFVLRIRQIFNVVGDTPAKAR
jgi:adenylate cyclase